MFTTRTISTPATVAAAVFLLSAAIQEAGRAATAPSTSNVGVLRTTASPIPNRFSYSWPVRPFNRQHPVRGYFGDPRIGMTPEDAEQLPFRDRHLGRRRHTRLCQPHGHGRPGHGFAPRSSRSSRSTGAPSSSTGTSSPQSPTVRTQLRARPCSDTSPRAGGMSTSPMSATGPYVDPLRPGALGPLRRLDAACGQVPPRRTARPRRLPDRPARARRPRGRGVRRHSTRSSEAVGESACDAGARALAGR